VLVQLPTRPDRVDPRGRIVMKIVRYFDGDARRPGYGVVIDDQVHAAAGDLFSGLQAGPAVGPLSAVRLLTPVTPGKVVCVGLNYAAHVTERDATRKVPDEPVIFMKPVSSLIGPGEAIEIAYPDHETQHEAELVVVIGKTADHVAATDALSFVLGYTCGNDVSDRDLQKKDGQWVRAKGFRTYGPMGPWIETEFDLTAAPVISRVNGEVRQSQTTAAMLWDVPTLISYISGIMTLDPGDVIMTGTPEGVGPIRPGDSCEIEIGGIGTLKNPVTAAAVRPVTAPAAKVPR
jgi:2-keto-4-pentenoate hydratase/2-oxohepta-3-ene-1,7-dioic acid hydratase in catechol pathway